MPTARELSDKLDQIIVAVHALEIRLAQLEAVEKTVGELKYVLVGPNSDDGLVVRVDRVERVVSVIRWIAITVTAPLLVGFVGALIYLVMMHPQPAP